MSTLSSRIPIAFVAVLAVGAALIWNAFIREPAPAPPDTNEPEPLAISDPPPPDPRTSFPSVFRNVKPEVKYLGDASCAACHAKIDKNYHAHPMGKSAGFVDRTVAVEHYEAKARTAFSVEGFDLRVEKSAAGVIHRVAARDPAGMPLPEYECTADLAIGSGKRGRSYLSLQGGAVWQTPISWFSETSQWALSPGFDLGSGGRRAINSDCLFCHVDRVEVVPGAVNRYREPLLPIQASIGCERCHGPGGLHVAERSASEVRAESPDTSIVNPKHLPAELRAGVCAQCHLQGEERIVRRGRALHEFRPGLPLEQFVSVFVRHPDLADLQRSVGQFEQMERSRCFTASNGRLGCTTCHDPHETPATEEKLGVYRSKCLTCHKVGDRECSAPVADRQPKGDACTLCHMPRSGSSNITHASVTDHRISRRPATQMAPLGLAPGVSPLVLFAIGRHAPPEPERDRDLGIALARLLGKMPGAANRDISGLAADRLNRSLQVWRGDADAWTAMSFTRAVDGELKAARNAALKALALDPESDSAVAAASETAIAAGRFEDAVAVATKLVLMNPTAIEPRMTRALALLQMKEWSRAEADCRLSLRIHPLYPKARLLLAVCLHRQGDVPSGRKEAEIASALVPPRQRREFIQWYQGQTK